METIFHEKQEGSLCAQHCLNALLQGPYFTPVDLGTLAQQMDDEERMRMAENGEESEEYRKFLAQPSGNMDDSGYFSVQVISSALRVWGLELVPYTSAEERARDAFKCPSKMKAFICHYRDHWFTIRRLGNQWFNLNSLLAVPELISDTYLAMFLAQLQQEGYCIFVVFGDLPDCEADQVLRVRPAVPIRKNSQGPKLTTDQEDKDLQEALLKSLESNNSLSPPPQPSNSDSDLQKAIRLSLEQSSDSSIDNNVENNVNMSDAANDDDDDDDDDEETQLRKAISMSLECKTPSKPSTPSANPEEVRQRRLEFFNQLATASDSKNS